MSEQVSRSPLIYSKICEVMGKIGAIPKSQKNKGFGEQYNFRGIDQLYDALNKPMSESGIVAMPHVCSKVVTERKTSRGGIIYHTEVDVNYSFFASDGSCVEARVRGEALDMSDKGTSKAMQAAYKYACFQIFNVPVSPEAVQDADQDTHSIGCEQEPKPKKQTQQKAAPKKQCEQKKQSLESLPNKAEEIKISEKQQRELFDVIAARGASHKYFAAFLKEKTGSDAYAEIKHNHFNRLIELVHQGKFDEQKQG